MRLIVDEIASAITVSPLTAAREPLAITGVSTDSRATQAGDLFVALISPKTDGHDFVQQAIGAGATALVVSQVVNAPPHIPVFQVPDTRIAYGQIARTWRDKFDIPVIGVTGSVGKTTTKEMLAAALSALGPILKTEASQNNETGVPKALLRLGRTHKAAVIEMGMRGVGEIAYLCDITRPTVGVVTAIAENHMELLGSMEAIADAKGELLDALPATGATILNCSSQYYERLRAKARGTIVSFGAAEAADYVAKDIRRAGGGWRFTVKGVAVEISSASRHDVDNALAALATADILNIPLADAANALRSYIPPPMRMQVIAAPWGGTVLNDAYNAAPASVRSALETLASLAEGRKIAFLGDMKELGEQSTAAHRELGAAIADLGGLDSLYAVGELAALIPGVQQAFLDSDAAARFARETFVARTNDTILVKGSRAMAMERIVDALQTRHE